MRRVGRRSGIRRIDPARLRLLFPQLPAGAGNQKVRPQRQPGSLQRQRAVHQRQCPDRNSRSERRRRTFWPPLHDCSRQLLRPQWLPLCRQLLGTGRHRHLQPDRRMGRCHTDAGERGNPDERGDRPPGLHLRRRERWVRARAHLEIQPQLPRDPEDLHRRRKLGLHPARLQRRSLGRGILDLRSRRGADLQVRGGPVLDQPENKRNRADRGSGSGRNRPRTHTRRC